MAKNKHRFQIKVYREGKPPAWLAKKGTEFVVVLEPWFATKLTLQEAKQLIEVLQPTLPLTTALEIDRAVFNPPRNKREKRQLPRKKGKKDKPRLLRQDYRSAPKPIERLRNPFPEGKLDVNSEQFRVNEPLSCRNCGICRVCLDKML